MFYPIYQNDSTYTDKNCLTKMSGVWVQVSEEVVDGDEEEGEDNDTETSTTVPNTCSSSNSNQNSAETQSTDLDCDLDDAPPTTTTTTTGPVDLTTVEDTSDAADRNKSSNDAVKVNEIHTFIANMLNSPLPGSKSEKMLYEAIDTFIPPDILDKIHEKQKEEAATSALESGGLSSVSKIREIFDDENSSDGE